MRTDAGVLWRGVVGQGGRAVVVVVGAVSVE